MPSINDIGHENVRTIFNTPIEELQKSFLNQNIHDDYNYIYVGEVVDINDPLKIGRVKVKVINLFDEIVNADIPWFLPCQSFVDGAFSVPNVGDYVETYFERGDIYCPKYFAKAVNKNQIPSQASKDYPNTIVLFETEKGSYCTINKSTGEYKIVQSTGSQLLVGEDGSIEMDVKSTKIVIDKDGKVEIKAPEVKISGTSVGGVPGGSGGFCVLPNCLFTGATHRADTITTP